jgi:acetyl-CoA/propionyl-CoA carboxylase carboxyl transferase subunit
MTQQIEMPPRPRMTAVADNPLVPAMRLARLMDPGTLVLTTPADEGAATAARGLIDGQPVIAFCTDATRKGGAVGLAECVRITDAIELATAEGVPVIGLWHSGGAKLADGVEAMHGIGQIFAAMVAASGRIPQISVVLGPAAGGAAYGPALTDVVIMAPRARIFITGPDVVRSVTGEEIDMAGLGGSEAHGRKSGVSHVIAESEEDAYARARAITGLLTSHGRFDVKQAGPDRDLRALLPESPRRAYDVHPLIHRLLDGGFEEFQAKWAPNIVVGLGRLGGGSVGIVASNPLRKGGCLDSLSAEKASRFVRMCDAFGILHRKRLAAAPDDEREALRATLIAEHERMAGGVERALALGVIDEVVEPSQTRHRLIRAFAEAGTARGTHGNIPL